jgi:hypothetical protein
VFEQPPKSTLEAFTISSPLEKIGNSRRINEVYLRGQKVDRAGLRAKWLAERNQKTRSSLK